MGGGGGVGKVEVINSKGCSRLLVGFSSSIPSFRGLPSFEPMFPATSSVGSEPVLVRSSGPFAGLVLCVTGLSKGMCFTAPSILFSIDLDVLKMLILSCKLGKSKGENF